MRIRRWRKRSSRPGTRSAITAIIICCPIPAIPAIEEELERGFEALKRRLGVKPIGYRAPYGEFTEELRAALVRHGIVYTSSFRDDVRPYRHRLADGTPGHDRAAGDGEL